MTAAISLDVQLARLIVQAQAAARVTVSKTDPLDVLTDLFTILICERDIAQQQVGEWQERALAMEQAAAEAERKIERIVEIAGGQE